MESKSILVIEDDKLNMKLFREVLRLNNYLVLEAVDAETGIEMAKKTNPDLILMDIQLPGMDGLRATQEIVRNPELKGIPVVALTSYAMKEDRKKALDAGCIGYITKPISPRRFGEELQGFFNGKKPASSLYETG